MDKTICRACMRPLMGTRDAIDIVNSLYKKTYDLSKIITNIFNAKIETSDEISKNVCFTCADKIIEIYHFCLMYHESDKKLRRILKQGKESQHFISWENGKQLESVFIEAEPNFESIPKLECLVCARRFQFERTMKEHQCNCVRMDLNCSIDSECIDIRTIEKVFTTEADELLSSVGNDHLSKQTECNSNHLDFQKTLRLKKKCRNFHSMDKINQNTKQSDINNEWNCEECNETFNSKLALRDHRKSHQEPKKYNENAETGMFHCGECGKGFNTREKVQMHVRRHDDIKCLCNMCGKWLSCLGNLRKHYKAVHLNQKNLACPICDHRFTSSFRLRDHVNSHNGIRAYACEKCPTRFFNYSAVKRHMDTVHSDEKKYMCTVCSKTFKIPNNLKTHMFAHTGIFEHSCEQCGKGFRRKKKMLQHIQNCHVNNIEKEVVEN